jgi:hypothetical protein
MEQVGKNVPVIKIDVDAQKQYAMDFGNKKHSYSSSCGEWKRSS